jgi:NADH-quinone oxidoreductase subunit N
VLEILKASLAVYLPEIASVALMCLLLIIEAGHRETGNGRGKLYAVAFAGLAGIAALLVVNLARPAGTAFYGAVQIDPFSTLIKLVMVLGTIGAGLIALRSKDIYEVLKAEFMIMALGVLVGGMLLASANNMLTMYLGVETLSILSYALSAMKREDATSTEAGLKYALYGGLTAGIMLFGVSHIYGLTGSIQFPVIVEKLATIQGADQLFLMASFLLFFAGVGYKVSAFPFHMWSPDVYQGAPIPVTAFFAVVPKLAGLAALVRVSQLFFGNSGDMGVAWVGLLHVVAALTMTVGNVSAIGQDSVKRMLAFSSIGHIGMMIMGVVVLNEVGVRAILYYAMAYLFMTVVAFWIVSVLNDTYNTDSQTVFRGLIHRHPLMAIAMSVVLFSLAGMPPLSGFVAKFNIISVVVEKGYFGLAFIAALNSVVALYYYMKLIKEMIMGQPESREPVAGFAGGVQGMVVVLTVPVLLMGVFWEGLMTLSGGAKLFIK